MHPILPLPTHGHPPSTPKGFRNVQQQFLWTQRTVHLTFYQSAPLLHMCTFDIFSSSIYSYCLLHLGVISAFYFSPIIDVIAEKRFVLVLFLHGSEKRARKTAQASLHPVVFPVLHFLWLWGWGFSTLVYLYLLCDVKNMLWHWPLSNSTPLVNEKSVWETASTELSLEKDR